MCLICMYVRVGFYTLLVLVIRTKDECPEKLKKIKKVFRFEWYLLLNMNAHFQKFRTVCTGR